MGYYFEGSGGGGCRNSSSSSRCVRVFCVTHFFFFELGLEPWGQSSIIPCTNADC